MLVRYNRNRTFKVWEVNGTWFGVETKDISQGVLCIPLNSCYRGNDVDSVVRDIHIKCRYDEFIENGMEPMEAMQEALFCVG